MDLKKAKELKDELEKMLEVLKKENNLEARKQIFKQFKNTYSRIKKEFV